MNVTLLTGRTIDQGTGKEYGKLSKEYWDSVAMCEIDPDDMEQLRVRGNENVKITTEFGSAIVRAVKSKRAPHPRIIFIPYGPWANLIVNPKTEGTGMPRLKGIPAKIAPAPKEKVLDLSELLKKYYARE